MFEGVATLLLTSHYHGDLSVWIEAEQCVSMILCRLKANKNNYCNHKSPSNSPVVQSSHIALNNRRILFSILVHSTEGKRLEDLWTMTYDFHVESFPLLVWSTIFYLTLSAKRVWIHVEPVDCIRTITGMVGVLKDVILYVTRMCFFLCVCVCVDVVFKSRGY